MQDLLDPQELKKVKLRDILLKNFFENSNHKL